MFQSLGRGEEGGSWGRRGGRRDRREVEVRKKWKGEAGKMVERWTQVEGRQDYLMTRRKRKGERRFPRRGMRLHCCHFHCW